MSTEAEPRQCVYTCLLGQYEVLNEQPFACESKLPFFCFTDDRSLQSNTWKIIHITPEFPADLVRSQRVVKILAHRMLPDFDISLYIDNSVILNRRPEDILATHLVNATFALPTHDVRPSVLEEFLEVAKLELDESTRVFQQMQHYAQEAPTVFQQMPYWCAILLRDHRDPTLCRAMEIWLSQVLRYSRRDQLSSNYAFHRVGISPNGLPIAAAQSDFHTWPHAEQRQPRKEWGNLDVTALLTIGSDRQKEDIQTLRSQILDPLLLAKKAWEMNSTFQERCKTLNAHVQRMEEKLRENQQKILKLRNRQQTLQTKLASRTASRDAMKNSLSLRLTAPLRKLHRLFYKIIRKTP